MSGARLLRALLLPLLVGVALPGSASGDEPRARDVYVRRRTTIEKTARWIVGEARVRRVGQVLIVFDAASFAPPPGATEFSMDRVYADDLSAWLLAIGKEVADATCPFRVTSTLAPKTISVGEPGWEGAAEHLVTRPWWEGDGVQKLEPATKWIGRLLALTESGIQPGYGDDRRMLVLVTGTVTPERWVFLGLRPGWESSWRTRLRDIGTYWDAEAIAARLQADGCVFYPVAPEAHFCDFRPYVELPELPWVARPMYPPIHLREEAVVTPSEGGLPRRRQSVPRRRRPPVTPHATPGGAPPSLHGSGWRFESWTPYWFPRTSGTLLFNNHAPSGYGAWPYARVAAKTGGKYHFYPFPPTRWLDPCPYDPQLLDALAPDLVHPAEYHGRLKGDRALDAVLRATSLVLDGTPWADLHRHDRTASGWSSFRRADPLRFHADWFLRRKPFEVVFEEIGDARGSLFRTASRIQEEVLPRYDEAIAILDRAIVEEKTRRKKSAPRAVADLVLARYWFAMSAFHLEAFSIYGIETERFIPDRLQGPIERWWVTYIPTIKMSDVLEAYDGRELAPEDEERYERWVLPDQPGMQGNILLIDPEHPDYRARRKLGKVLENLDPRLRRRALDMVFAARRVMRRYAKSGWGWTTYYSIAYTFIFKPLPIGDGPPPIRPGDKEPPPPTTPQGPTTTPGGSTPSGPATR